MTDLRLTPLHEMHRELGARMAPFAGYDMPIQYASGILAEHGHTRSRAGLFDVAHMGQAFLDGPDHSTTALALEALCPADIMDLLPGRQRYTQLLNAEGGIVDDLMVSRPLGAEGRLALVVNASRKEIDFALIGGALPPNVSLTVRGKNALIALQGPLASSVMARLAPRDGAEKLRFMGVAPLDLAGFAVEASRSGYTGEDGYEISVDGGDAEALARRLLAEPEVAMIGLGARDTLRLEAGLCLYGHELDETTDPIEAGLAWSIPKRRRAEGGFPGAERIQRALAEGTRRVRVGLRPEGRAPARDGAAIVDSAGAKIGVVTSGGFGPSVGAPIAMGYIAREHAGVGTPVGLLVRDKVLPSRVVALPFLRHNYFRG